MTTEEQLPERARLVRYAGSTKWHSLKKKGNWRAFKLRIYDDGRIEPGLSMSWYQLFAGSLETQLDEVRRLARVHMGKQGFLLEIIVGSANALLKNGFGTATFTTLKFVKDPLPPKYGTRPDQTYGMVFERDASHCLFSGMECFDDQKRKAIASVLAFAVTREFPAAKADD